MRIRVLAISFLFSAGCFAAMDTAQITPKGESPLGVSYQFPSEHYKKGGVYIFTRGNISEKFDAGGGLGVLRDDPDDLFVLKGDLKYLLSRPDNKSLYVATGWVMQIVYFIPSIGGRFMISGEISFFQPYMGFEFGVPPYGYAWFGCKIRLPVKFALFFEYIPSGVGCAEIADLPIINLGLQYSVPAK